jgi:16S rRNA (uracil1498-N3)-methyltransferase
MTRRRFVADEAHGDRAALAGDHARHLARVLRARIGQEFDIAVGREVRRGRITSVTDDRVEFSLEEQVEVRQVAPITLLLAIFKFDRMEWAIEKCTELGVARIVPVIAQRTETRLGLAAAKRVERWHRIALQATEQARRAQSPVIEAPRRLQEAVPLADKTCIVLAESETNCLLQDALAGCELPLSLAAGPEGGWTESELELFSESGWKRASLGATILRAETAAIAGLVLALSRLR